MWAYVRRIDRFQHLRELKNEPRVPRRYTLGAFLDEAHTPEVNYLRLLADSRGAMQRYFVHGRLAAPVRITPTPETFMAPKQHIPPRNAGPFPTLSSAVWVAGDTGGGAPASLCVFLATATAKAVPAAFELDMALYGFTGSSFEVALVGRDGRATKVTTVASSTVKLSRVVGGRSLEMLEIKPSQH